MYRTKGTSIETSAGRRFDFLAPCPEDVHLDDIARALGNTCRFGGHCKGFFSVAEHAMNVGALVWRKTRDPELALAALHHDSHEAYVGDLPTPLKIAFGQYTSVYADMVGAIDLAIAECLGIDEELFHAKAVKDADRAALRWEAYHLKDSQGMAGDWPWREPGPELLAGQHRPIQYDPYLASSAFRVNHEYFVAQRG